MWLVSTPTSAQGVGIAGDVILCPLLASRMGQAISKSPSAAAEELVQKTVRENKVVVSAYVTESD